MTSRSLYRKRDGSGTIGRERLFQRFPPVKRKRAMRAALTTREVDL
jgi:hypothetical protein